MISIFSLAKFVFNRILTQIYHNDPYYYSSHIHHQFEYLKQIIIHIENIENFENNENMLQHRDAILIWELQS